MPVKISSTARILYFHVDDKDEVRVAWEDLASEAGMKISEKDSKISFEKSVKHELTSITSIKGEKYSLYLSLYKNTIIITGLFYGKIEPLNATEKFNFKEKAWYDKTIGGATIVIVPQKGSEKIAEQLATVYTTIETSSGILHQLEEKEKQKEHIYLLARKKEGKEIQHFLTEHFPIFDFAIHKLHKERDYFMTQRTWVMKEKTEIDKAVGDILHRRIVGETLNPGNIGVLEKEIDILSSKYAFLVNDGHLIRKARVTLEEDVKAVYSHLGSLGTIISGKDLNIIKPSEELKKSLSEDELSLSYAIKNTKTAIDIVRTNVDLLRSREDISLQEEALSFQVAAGVLEFIIIFYYSIASWEHLIGVHRFELIPPPIRFASIFLFASFSVVLTHFVGESYRKKWKLNSGMIISGSALLLVFLYVTYLSIQTGLVYHP